MEPNIGSRISAQRKKHGLTQEQLAEKLSVTAQAVSKWENNQSCPDIATLPKLSAIFGCTTDELLGIEPVRKAKETELTPAPCHEASNEGLHITRDNFELKLDYGTRRNAIGIAVLVLAVGALALLVELMKWSISFWSILWPTALLVFGLFGKFPKFSFYRLGCVLFGGYFLLDNLELLPFDLGSGLILPVILLLFGGSLLVNALRKNRKPLIHFSHNGTDAGSNKNCTTDNEHLDYSASFSDDHRVISMDRLSSGSISTSFGDYTLDLSEVEEVAENCALTVNSSFGEVTLLIPAHYRVVCTDNSSFGDLEIQGEPAKDPIGTIHITANTSFGDLTIRYI